MSREPYAEGLVPYEMEHFLESYTNVRFGWAAVLTLARNHLQFPGVLEGDDEVLWRAYLHNCDSKYFSQDIWEAQMLTRPDMIHYRRVVEALCLIPEATIQKIAETTRLRYGVVQAYEKLFFNVLDRKLDELFICLGVSLAHRKGVCRRG